VSAEWPLACPERLDQTRSEGRTGEDRRIQSESGAKTVAAQPRLGYAGLAGMAKMEILVQDRVQRIVFGRGTLRFVRRFPSLGRLSPHDIQIVTVIRKEGSQ